MPEINVDINYFDHIKTRRLVNRLKRGAAELPLRLWCYTGKHYPKDGRLVGHTAEDIESAIEWWGKAGECVKALLEIKFLDLDGEGIYSVHNWLKRSGHLAMFSDRARKAALVRWGKDAKGNASSNAPSIGEQCPNDDDTNDTKLTNDTDASIVDGIDEEKTAEGSNPANRLAREVGIEHKVGPKQRGELSRLIAIDGYEAALKALKFSVGEKKIGVPACIHYAEKIVVGDKAKRDSNGAHQPSGKAVRVDG